MVILLNAVCLASFNASKIVKISFVVHEREQKNSTSNEMEFFVNDLKT